MLSFSSPTLFLAALSLATAVIATMWLRRVDLRPLGRLSIAMGLVLLALAAGGLILSLPDRGFVAVMVDVSPSTRTANYRDVAALRARANQLLMGAPFEVFYFAQSSVHAKDWPPVAEIASERTTLDFPERAQAILLFSDGRFDTRSQSLPPVFAVIDPSLEQSGDARVARMEVRGEDVAVHVQNDGEPRALEISGAGAAVQVGGSQVVTAPGAGHSAESHARLNAGDAWPENDALSIRTPPPPRLERWWVGGDSSPPGWTRTDLPTDPGAYLRAAVIAIDNMPVDAIGASALEALAQYVRDLGGGVMILGGERAFAAGGYPGTPLDTLSPLASTPPEPTTHWVLLADSSGSMAQPAGAKTRWQLASNALSGLLRRLPPDDPVSIGSFARELRWWSRGRSARDTAALELPPNDVAPQGPTNLQQALESLATGSVGSLPTEVLLLSDADTALDVNALSGSLRSKRIRVHLLATRDVAADNPVRRVAESTGGAVLSQADPDRWYESAAQLLRGAAPAHVETRPVEARYAGPLAALATQVLERWNRVWPRDGSEAIAVASIDGREQIMAARWNRGAGRVAGAAFRPTNDAVEAIAQLVASEPRDPRFTVRIDAGPTLRVRVDAIDRQTYLNDLPLRLHLFDDQRGALPAHSIPQVAPGAYEIELPAPRNATLAVVRLAESTIAPQAIAARYAPEFDAVGNDLPALRRLAERTGGRLIAPGDSRAIDFPRRRKQVQLTTLLAISGAALIALGLIHWKLA